jgi:outer membrane biosynthesis protein TonB
MVVIVSAEGTVERVQLVEGPARMPDMMMLSGVKTWRFTPAFKDGEPVRYRTVISWAALP